MFIFKCTIPLSRRVEPFILQRKSPKWFTTVLCVIKLSSLFTIIKSVVFFFFFLRMVCLKSFVCCVKIYQPVQINTWPSRQCVSLDLSNTSHFLRVWIFLASQTSTFSLLWHAESLRRVSFDRRVRLTGWICFWKDGEDNETALSDGHLFWAQPHQKKTQTDACFPEELSVWQTGLQIGSAALSGTSAAGKVNRYQRPVDSLGCSVDHKAECLCWGCSVCVFVLLEAKDGNGLL